MNAHVWLMATSAGVVFALGSAHLALTFVGLQLHPDDPQLRESMLAAHPRLTRRTSMWDCWLGFNASHSAGALLFGLVYGYLALALPDVLFRSTFLLSVGGAMLLGLTTLGLRYWFNKPLAGTSVATGAYGLALLLAP